MDPGPAAVRIGFLKRSPAISTRVLAIPVTGGISIIRIALVGGLWEVVGHPKTLKS